MRQLVHLIAITLMSALAGCGGGSGNDSGGSTPPPPPSPAKPGGYYVGTFTQDGDTFGMEGLIMEDGYAVLMSEFGIYVAELDMDGEAFDEDFKALTYPGHTWDGTNSVLDGRIKGTVNERESIEASFTLDDMQGTVKLEYDGSLYEDGASTPQMIGDWGYTVLNTEYSINMTFSSNGTFFGQDSDGCTFEGKWTIPDTRYNAYRIPEATINCGDGSEDWQGIAFIYFNAQSNRDVLVVGIHDQNHAYVDLFEKR